MKKVVDYLEKYYKESNHNCSEAIFLAAREAWEIDLPEETVNMMAGFGGGMGSASVCGAITGGVAALSCKFVEGGTGHNSPLLMHKVRRYLKLTKEAYGSIDCKDLRPQFFTTEERCFNTIHHIAEILDQVYAEEA